MASIQKITLKDGTEAYKIVVLLSSTGGADGKQVRKSKTFRPDPTKSDRQNQKELRQLADRFEEECKDGSIAAYELTLRQYAKQWVKEYVDSNVAPTTAHKYKDQLDKMILPHIGHIKMHDLKPSTVASLIRTLEETGYHYGERSGFYSARSLGDAKATLSTLCTSAVLDGLLPSNPCTVARVRTKRGAKQKQEKKSFSLDQAQRFLDIIEKPLPIISPAHEVKRGGKIVQIREYVTGHYNVQLKYKCAFQLAIFAGFRAEECCGLEWQDVNFKDNTIEIKRAAVRVDGETITKSPKSAAGYRKIYLPAMIMRNLDRLRREMASTIISLGNAWNGPRKIDNNPVFSQVEGGRMHRSTLNKELHRVIRSWNASCNDDAAKLPELTFHQLRHTSATLLIAQGMEPTAIAARLGHSDASITLSIYAHSFEERDQEASKALEEALLNGARKKA